MPGLAAAGEVGRAVGESAAGAERGLLLSHQPRQRLAPLAPGVGGAHDVLEPRVGSARALPVEREVDQHALERVAIAQPLPGLGQLDHLFGDERFWQLGDPGRQARGGRDAQRLSEHAVGGGEQVERQVIDEFGVADRVRAERDAALVHAHAQAEAPDHVVVAAEVGKRDRAGALRAQLEGGGARLARCDIAEQDGRLTLEHGAADRGGRQRDRHRVGRDRRGIQDRRARLVRFAAADRARVGEGEREVRVAHQHAAGCAPLDLHQACRESVEVAAQHHVDHVQALAQTLDEELGLPDLVREQAADVVAGAELPVGPGSCHRQ